jgi:hypothetical protein
MLNSEFPSKTIFFPVREDTNRGGCEETMAVCHEKPLLINFKHLFQFSRNMLSCLPAMTHATFINNPFQ